MQTGSLIAAAATLLLVAAPADGQERMMVTPDSHLEDVDGETLSYERFVELTRTGRFAPRPIRNDAGEVVGFRLTRKSTGGSSAGVPELTGPIRGLDGPVEVPMEVARGRLLVPATVHGPEGSKAVLFLFDTGTFAPVIWLPEIRDAVGTRDGRLDSVTVAGVTVEQPATGSYGSPDALREGGRRARDAADRFDDRPVAGIMGATIFREVVLSLDAARERLVLRPADRESRTLFEREPVAAADYRTEQHNVWIPVSVNGTEGFAHLDTGYTHTWVASTATDGRQVDSYRVGGTELLPHLSDAELRVEERGGRYGSVPLDVIANLGVDALADLVVTIDAQRERVYFERSGPGPAAPPLSPPAGRSGR